MEKFMMIILAVALVASVASAATLDVTGNTGGPGNAMPGDTLTMKWNPGTDAAGDIYGGFSDFVLNVSQGTFVSGTWNLAGAWLLKNDLLGTVNGAGFDLYLAASGFPVPAGTNPLFTLVFTVPAGAAAGSHVNIAGISGSYSTSDGVDVFAGQGSPTASLNVVPEPVTLVLLGLGGLFLRRRK